MCISCVCEYVIYAFSISILSHCLYYHNMIVSAYLTTELSIFNFLPFLLLPFSLSLLRTGICQEHNFASVYLFFSGLACQEYCFALFFGFFSFLWPGLHRVLFGFAFLVF